MLIMLLVFFPMLGAAAAWFTGRRADRAELRDILVIDTAVIEFVLSFALLRGRHVFSIPDILGSGLYFAADGFRAGYGVITAFLWAGAAIFGKEYFAHEPEGLNRYWFFFLVTLGATQGVMLSADLMTAFVFFEILSFTSFTWVIHEQTREAIRAAYTYLFIAVIGGLVLFLGLLLIRHSAGTLMFSKLREAAAGAKEQGWLRAGFLCVLFGFGCKAGMVPVHVWLPKAHPAAPSPASALLSGILTKVGVYGILMTASTAMYADAGCGVCVLVLGAATMLHGAVLALFSVNLKRTLACSSMSQIGFILTGIGMLMVNRAAGSAEGEALAAAGIVLHMMNHSLIKLTLFLAAGVVVMNLHSLDLNEIRGWGRKKGMLKAAFALGALGISGVPLFNGYLSKTMLHESIVSGIEACRELGGMMDRSFVLAEGAEAVSGNLSPAPGWLPSLAGWLSGLEGLFLFAGGCTFAYMLKLFLCIFVEKNADPDRQSRYDRNPACMNRVSTAVIFGSALLMPLLGQPSVSLGIARALTGFTGDYAEQLSEFAAFSPENLKGGAISLAIGALLYGLFIKRVLYGRTAGYRNLWPAWLDLEEGIYRPLLTRVLPFLFGNLMSLFGENRLTAPLSKGILFAGTVIGRALDCSLDFLAMLLRKTVFREVKVRGRKERTPDLLGVLREETRQAAVPILQNFSFALMMTCIGILLILGVLIFYVVQGVR